MMHRITYTYHHLNIRVRNVLMILVFGIGCSGGVMAQPSFEQVFEGEPYERVVKATRWAQHHSDPKDPENALFHLNRLWDEAKDRDDRYIELVAEYRIAYYHAVELNEGQYWLDEMDKITEKTSHFDPMLCAVFRHSTGLAYYHAERKYAKGLGLLLQARETFLEFGYENYPGSAALLINLAGVYYPLGNYRQTIELLIPAQSYSDTAYPNTLIHLFNTIGLAYRNLNMPDSALYYFEKTLGVAYREHDSAWIGIASVNISKVYLSKGEYDKALPYAQARYQGSKIKGDGRISNQDSCEALIVLARIDIHNGLINQALEKLLNAEQGLYFTQTYFNMAHYDLRYQLYQALGDAYKQKGEPVKAYTSYRNVYSYKDSMRLVRYETNSMGVLTEVKAQQYISKEKQLRDQKQLSLQARNFSLLVLLLAGVWVFILYNRQRLANRKDNELFENRQQLLYTEKLHAEEQLTDYMHLLQEKNKKLGEIQSELERLTALPRNVVNNEALESIEKLKKTVIITDDDWFRFKDLFENVHLGFFSRLKKQFPDITPAEMRLMALLKLGVSINNMADMLGVSPEAVRKTGYRFKKKMSQDINRDLGEIADSI